MMSVVYNDVQTLEGSINSQEHKRGGEGESLPLNHHIHEAKNVGKEFVCQERACNMCIAKRVYKTKTF